MEEVFDILCLNEDTRKDLRKLLVGITPSTIAKIGRYESIEILVQWNVPVLYAAAICYTSVTNEESKSS